MPKNFRWVTTYLICRVKVVSTMCCHNIGRSRNIRTKSRHGSSQQYKINTIDRLMLSYFVWGTQIPALLFVFLISYTSNSGFPKSSKIPPLSHSASHKLRDSRFYPMNLSAEAHPSGTMISLMELCCTSTMSRRSRLVCSGQSLENVQCRRIEQCWQRHLRHYINSC